MQEMGGDCVPSSMPRAPCPARPCLRWRDRRVPCPPWPRRFLRPIYRALHNSKSAAAKQLVGAVQLAARAVPPRARHGSCTVGGAAAPLDCY